MNKLSRHLVSKKHNCLKYVIWNRQIATRSGGWKWQAYYGSNPHNKHMHVSVGRGSDGRSTGPYDETTPWGVASSGSNMGGDLIGLKKGAKGAEVTALQGCLRNAGFPVGTIDGVYGDKTAAALLACRKSRGSSATNGNEVTGDAYHQLLAAQILNMSKATKGPKGDPGPAGPAGPAGKDGTVPKGTVITSTVT